MSTQSHYDKHLGPIYSWMVGDFTAGVQTMDDYFRRAGIQPVSNKLAIDLGCGHGLQAVSLAKLGFRVIGLDSCAQLLDQLRENSAGLAITAIHCDLQQFPAHMPEAHVDVIVCMGDTLTHLNSRDAVQSLIRQASVSLVEGGWLAVSFRDYVTTELDGDQRFLPVRSDDQRIHTCFLEYAPTTVRVHDIVHLRTDNGWQLSVSSYDKLRLDPKTVLQAAAVAGLRQMHAELIRGMCYFAFRKIS